MWFPKDYVRRAVTGMAKIEYTCIHLAKQNPSVSEENNKTNEEHTFSHVYFVKPKGIKLYGQYNASSMKQAWFYAKAKTVIITNWLHAF